MVATVLAQSYSYSSSGVTSIVQLVFWLACIAAAVYVAVDANKYADNVWQAAGQNKMLWIILPIVLSVCCGCFGLIPVIIYFVSIKKKLDETQAGGAGGYGGYGQPAPGGYGQPAPGYGTPPAPGGYGTPPAPGGYQPPAAPSGGDYGTPPAPGGYTPPPAPGGYSDPGSIPPPPAPQ